MKYKFQLITFKDHYRSNDWIKPETYKPDHLMLTYCGWVTKETDEFVILSQGYDPPDKEGLKNYDGHIHILKECIKKRKTIKLEDL